MARKKTLKIILPFVFLILASFLGLRGLTGEDTWLCQNGQWVKHGQPSAPKPTTPCLSSDKKANLFQVIKVIDGDTFEIKGGQKVRLIGMDTPELDEKDKTKKCYALKAFLKTKELLEGREVRLEKDVSETDQYGRWLRYVYLDDLFVNDYLVKQGYAYLATFPPDVKYQDQFRQSQQEAQERKLGFWGEIECPD
ncbi:thermonuclease family protein [Candidatus Shapirobacteria bacterium]|nr:thermonuclease family protein [Candidatus Shapirobacteria bacterium]